MDQIFPLGLPTPTAFYLVLYVATFVIHHGLMHYVVVGSIYVCCTSYRGRSAVSSGTSVSDVVRDWMPFALSAAITAGVAPLLFVQIVYPRNFYTANLLLSWRWMLVVPVLIVAFYLLYLIKSSFYSRRSFPIRLLLGATTAGCFLFVGFCWTANHLIANTEGRWPEIYATSSMMLPVVEVIQRTLIWVGGAAATFAVAVAWQIGPRRLGDPTSRQIKELAVVAAVGLITALAAGGWYLVTIGDEARTLLTGSFAGGYLLLAAVGAVLQVGGWLMAYRGQQISTRALVLVSAICAVTLFATAVGREAIRLSQLDIKQLYARHAEAAAIEGWVLFLVFAAVNGTLIGVCVWLVRRHQDVRQTGSEGQAAD